MMLSPAEEHASRISSSIVIGNQSPGFLAANTSIGEQTPGDSHDRNIGIHKLDCLFQIICFQLNIVIETANIGHPIGDCRDAFVPLRGEPKWPYDVTYVLSPIFAGQILD